MFSLSLWNDIEDRDPLSRSEIAELLVKATGSIGLGYWLERGVLFFLLLYGTGSSGLLRVLIRDATGSMNMENLD